MKLFFEKIFALILIGAIGGCANGIKTVLPVLEYSRAGERISTAQQCGELGLTSPSDVIWAKRGQYFKMSSFAVDESRLQMEIGKWNAFGPPTPIMCNKSAIEAREYQMMVEAHNASTDQNRREIMDAIRVTAPRAPIWCNKIGNMTMCN